MSDEVTCVFCSQRTARAVSGRRAGSTARVICKACVETLPVEAATSCDFCDHPSGQSARRGDVSICGDCLAFARQVLGDEDRGATGDEAHLDPAELWSELTPAPRPDVDPNAPATAHANLAVAFLEMGLVDDAREQVAEALALDPRHAIALRLLEKIPPPKRK
jgi:hypothetical protein